MIKKVIVASIPAILVVLSLIIERNSSSWLLWISLPLFVGSSTAFLSNLLAPVATERKTAIRIGILSCCVYIYFYILYSFVEYTNYSYNRSLEFIGFAIIGFFLFIIPTGLLLMAGVAIAGWFGAHLRMAISPKPSLE